jgi:ATP/maltotriose-dependent transcriptional regulator MalT
VIPSAKENCSTLTSRLTSEEQRLFRRLSVFVGGCELSALEAVCAALDDEADHVLEAVASLIDKSLLHQTEPERAEPRFSMLETIREYGLEVLASWGEAQATHQAHAAYYLALAEQAEPELTGPQQLSWFERLEQEHDNLRAALSWLLGQVPDGQSKEFALRLGGALRQFWRIRGHVSEGRRWLERALDESRGVKSTVRAKALTSAGHLTALQDDFSQAEVLCGEGLALYRELGDRRGSATALTFLGYTLMMKCNYVQARILLEEALALFREVGDVQNYALSLVLQGLVLLYQGDLAQAQARLEESRTLSRKVGYKRNLGFAIYFLGQIAFRQGDMAGARSLLEESLVYFREVGERGRIAEILVTQGGISLRQGDYTAARARLEESLQLSLELDLKWDIAGGLEGLAAVAAAQGEPRRATWLMSAAQALREACGSRLPSAFQALHEFTMASVHRQLGEQAFAAAWAEGRSMTAEQVLAAQEPIPLSTAILPEPSTPPPAKGLSTSPEGLTARELEVLRLLAQGLTSAQIAERLVISVVTVNFHVRSIYSKLGVTSRAAATRYAVEHHLV